MRKLAFCICVNKASDQLHSNCATDQRLCFHYIDSTIPLLPKHKIIQTSNHLLWLYCEPGLCRTWLETPKTGFLLSWLILVGDFVNPERVQIVQTPPVIQDHLCRIMRRLQISDQVRHKPSCTATEDGYIYRGLELRCRGIVPFYLAKEKVLISCVETMRS